MGECEQRCRQLFIRLRVGKRALNRALRAAEGDLLTFTDDDCRLHNEHINDLLRHHGADMGLVLRDGRIELGDPTDLPLSININPGTKRLRSPGLVPIHNERILPIATGGIEMGVQARCAHWSPCFAYIR
jgi:hypothetical protein